MRKLFSLQGVVLTLVSSLLILALVACEGASGTQGPAGSPGASGPFWLLLRPLLSKGSSDFSCVLSVFFVLSREARLFSRE